jgi:molybdopterin-binding protein
MDTPELALDIDLPRRAFSVRVALRVGAETLAVVGPSGSGKSSILRAVAGLERPACGRIALGEEVWFDAAARVRLPPERRSVGLVFQEYALFPHLSALENVAFGGRARAEELLGRLGIAHLAGARPGELSGGERQRVALARALARSPKVLLLDEPMAALDAHTRASVRSELRDLLGELRLPTLVVTHDFEDASALARTVAVLERGRVAQVGTPGDLVARPADPFVASLTGANLLTGRAEADGSGLTAVRLEGGEVVYSSDALTGPVGAVIHPVEITLGRSAARDSAVNHLRGRVVSIVPLGNRARVRIGPLTAEITAASLERLALAEGEEVVASFKATATRLIPLGAGLSGRAAPPPASGAPRGDAG